MDPPKSGKIASFPTFRPKFLVLARVRLGGPLTQEIWYPEFSFLRVNQQHVLIKTQTDLRFSLMSKFNNIKNGSTTHFVENHLCNETFAFTSLDKHISCAATFLYQGLW